MMGNKKPWIRILQVSQTCSTKINYLYRTFKYKFPEPIEDLPIKISKGGIWIQAFFRYK